MLFKFGRLNFSPNCRRHCTSKWTSTDDKLINHLLLTEFKQETEEGRMDVPGLIEIFKGTAGRGGEGVENTKVEELFSAPEAQLYDLNFRL